MKRAATGAAFAILFSLGMDAGAAVTYLSQDRSIARIEEVFPTPLGAQGGLQYSKTVSPVAQATDFGPFSATDPFASQQSSFDHSGIRARGEGAAPVNIPGGNLLNYARSGLSQTRIVFSVGEPTPFSSTWRFPVLIGATGPDVTLDGPGGQHFDLAVRNPAGGLPDAVTGVLSPGQWTFLALADGVTSPGLFNVELTLPEPAAVLPIGLAAAALVRRR